MMTDFLCSLSFVEGVLLFLVLFPFVLIVLELMWPV